MFRQVAVETKTVIICNVLNKEVAESEVCHTVSNFDNMIHISKEATEKYPCLKEERWLNLCCQAAPFFTAPFFAYDNVVAIHSTNPQQVRSGKSIEQVQERIKNVFGVWHVFEKGRFARTLQVRAVVQVIEEPPQKCSITGKETACIPAGNGRFVAAEIYNELPAIFKQPRWLNLLSTAAWVDFRGHFLAKGIWTISESAEISTATHLTAYPCVSDAKKVVTDTPVRDKTHFHIFADGEFCETVTREPVCCITGRKTTCVIVGGDTMVASDLFSQLPTDFKLRMDLLSQIASRGGIDNSWQSFYENICRDVWLIVEDDKGARNIYRGDPESWRRLKNWGNDVRVHVFKDGKFVETIDNFVKKLSPDICRVAGELLVKFRKKQPVLAARLNECVFAVRDDGEDLVSWSLFDDAEKACLAAEHHLAGNSHTWYLFANGKFVKTITSINV